MKNPLEIISHNLEVFKAPNRSQSKSNMKNN